MTAPTTSWLLWPRALCVGLLAVCFGTIGHVSAGGDMPGLVLLGVLSASGVLLAGFSMSGTVLLAPSSWGRLTALLVGGQFAVHVVLMSGQGAAMRVTMPTVDHAMIGHGATATGALATTGPTTGMGSMDHTLSGNLPMIGAHLVAALLVGLWLAYGERSVWTVIILAGRHVVAITQLLRPILALPQRRNLLDARAQESHPLICLWQTLPVRWRGPPLAASAR